MVWNWASTKNVGTDKRFSINFFFCVFWIKVYLLIFLFKEFQLTICVFVILFVCFTVCVFSIFFNLWIVCPCFCSLRTDLKKKIDLNMNPFVQVWRGTGFLFHLIRIRIPNCICKVFIFPLSSSFIYNSPSILIFHFQNSIRNSLNFITGIYLTGYNLYVYRAWCLYQMVAQNMLRTKEGK